MKLSISKLALLFGTPVVLLGYQNCAKLGTENLLGQTSSFVASDSTEMASSTNGKGRSPASDPMGDSRKLLAEVMQKCIGKDSKDEFVMESCLVLACQTPAKTAIQQKQMDQLCMALQRS